MGYFDDELDAAARGHRERVMVLAGAADAAHAGRASASPSPGCSPTPSALDDPYQRLQRTALVLNAVAFGTREEADRATRRVRAMHGRVRGVLTEPAGRFPAGTPYAADAPGAAAVDPRDAGRTRRSRSTRATCARWSAMSATRCGATTSSSARCSG